MPFKGITEEGEETVLLNHERRIGGVENRVALVENRVSHFETTAGQMLSMFEDLKKTVVSGNKESMEFLQSIVSHEQSVEKARMEFEQKIQQMKMETRTKEAEAKAERERKEEELKQQQAEFERQQKAETKEMTWKAIRKAGLWFAPAITVIVTLINEWVQTFVVGR